MKKAIIVVYGKDCKGIIYNVTKILFENGINILDIKQTIVDGYFNMLTVVDTTNNKNIDIIKESFSRLSKKMNLVIKFYLEETFTAMHRI